MPSSTGRRAGIYVRISQDREGAGLGVARQEKDCRVLAERLGWQVANVYCDNDISASDRRKKRKEYLRLLADVESGAVNAVITWHMDRLHRQPYELEKFIDLVEDRDVAIQTVKAGDIDASTPTGRMLLRVVGATDRYEVEHKAERIRRKHVELAEQGRRSGGTRAFGYVQVREPINSRMVYIREDVVEEEAAIIREAADRTLLGTSLRAVCRDLNERGVLSASGGPWVSTSLKRILLSPRLVGKRVHRGREYPAVWPAILDLETHSALKEILNDPKRRTNGGYHKAVLLTQRWHPTVLAMRQSARGQADGHEAAIVRLQRTGATDGPRRLPERTSADPGRGAGGLRRKIGNGALLGDSCPS
jgi:site-specific DNA recombinase